MIQSHESTQTVNEDGRSGTREQDVLAAFVRRKAARSAVLSSDGRRLKQCGTVLAEWQEDHLRVFPHLSNGGEGISQELLGTLLNEEVMKQTIRRILHSE